MHDRLLTDSNLSSSAVAYADAHDRAGRMLSTGVARKSLTWSESRRYFFNRLRRRLLEVSYEQKLASVSTVTGSAAAAVAQRKQLIASTFGLKPNMDDAAAADLLEKDAAKIDQLVLSIKEDALLAQLQALPADVRSRLAAKLS